MAPDSAPASEPTRLVVVTGGPGSGKTTLVEALAARGYTTVPEAAIQVIGELVAELGNEGQRQWRAEHGEEFQARILAMQIEGERALAPDLGPVFLDRGRHDGLAYCRFRGNPLPKGLLAALDGHRYDAVFLLATLTNFADRSASGRTSDRAASVEIAGAIAAVYQEYGMTPIFVPECSVEERVEFVLRALHGPADLA